jgi:signal transduction histidine kinase
MEAEDLEVYTDPAWLVYILDQFIGNALKYGQKHGEEKPGEKAPCLSIWTQKGQDSVTLWVEDYGEGIKDSDIRRIFEKGYTGSNYHNGRYKSTGMGLYMAAKIADRLGHKICVESQYGKGSRFGVVCRCS